MADKNVYAIREGWISIFGNIFLFVIKYWAGLVTGSIALIADAWHTLTDSISSIIVLITAKIIRKPADEIHPFGRGRVEHISAVIIGVLLALIAFDFVLEAIERFGRKEPTDFGVIAWVVTIISILAKEAMAQYAFWAAKKTNSSILKADGWHHRTDALSSVAILIGIAFGEVFWWTDAILGFVVAFMIGSVSYQILYKEIRALIGVSPSAKQVAQIRDAAQRNYGDPLHIHRIKMHKYGNHTELSFHIKLPPQMALEEAHSICTRIEQIIKRDFGYITTIHPEPIE